MDIQQQLAFLTTKRSTTFGRPLWAWRQHILCFVFCVFCFMFVGILLQPISWVKDFSFKWDLGSKASKPTAWANDMTDSCTGGICGRERYHVELLASPNK